MDEAMKKMRETLAHRFGETLPEEPADGMPQTCPETWRQLARRGSGRRFQERGVAPALIDTLCALALSAPTKSEKRPTSNTSKAFDSRIIIGPRNGFAGADYAALARLRQLR